MLRRESDSYLEATFPNGVGSFTFDYRKAYTGARELVVNNLQVAKGGVFGTSDTDDTIYTLTYEINVYGPVTIRIKNIGRHLQIDKL